jgi:hypothetical protein
MVVGPLTVTLQLPLEDVESLQEENSRMVSSERAPLWDSITHPFASVLDFAFGCHHTKLSRVFTLEGRSYKVCCDCGAKFDYSLRTMSIVTHRRLFPSLRRLRARRRHERRKLQQLPNCGPGGTLSQP